MHTFSQKHLGLHNLWKKEPLGPIKNLWGFSAGVCALIFKYDEIDRNGQLCVRKEIVC